MEWHQLKAKSIHLFYCLYVSLENRSSNGVFARLQTGSSNFSKLCKGKICLLYSSNIVYFLMPLQGNMPFVSNKLCDQLPEIVWNTFLKNTFLWWLFAINYLKFFISILCIFNFMQCLLIVLWDLWLLL